MSKERLEEIRDQLEESNSYDDNSNGYWYNAIKWLIEQAERADRLKVRCTEIAAESSAVENRLWKRINEYESALIFYADEENYKQYSDSFSDSGLSESKVSADGGYKARQAMRRK